MYALVEPGADAAVRRGADHEPRLWRVPDRRRFLALLAVHGARHQPARSGSRRRAARLRGQLGDLSLLLVPLVDRAKDRGQLEVDSILATFGLLFVMQGVVLVVFGGQYYSYAYLSVPVAHARHDAWRSTACWRWSSPR